jgi:hypothetical protein
MSDNEKEKGIKRKRSEVEQEPVQEAVAKSSSSDSVVHAKKELKVEDRKYLKETKKQKIARKKMEARKSKKLASKERLLKQLDSNASMNAEENKTNQSSDSIPNAIDQSSLSEADKQALLRKAKKSQKNKARKLKKRTAKHILQKQAENAGSIANSDIITDSADDKESKTNDSAQPSTVKASAQKASTKSKSDDAKNSSQANALALAYLDQWKNDNTSWKFQKVRQTYLLQNIYDANVIPGKSFKILLKYMQQLQGNSKIATLTEAQQILKNAEDNPIPESGAEQDEETLTAEQKADLEVKKQSRRKLERAMKVAEVLS